MIKPSTPTSTVIHRGISDEEDDDKEPDAIDPEFEDDGEEPDIDGLPTMPLSIGLMLTKNLKPPASR